MRNPLPGMHYIDDIKEKILCIVRLKRGHSFIWLGGCNNLIKSLTKFFRNGVCDIKRKKERAALQNNTVIWRRRKEASCRIFSLACRVHSGLKQRLYTQFFTCLSVLLCTCLSQTSQKEKKKEKKKKERKAQQARKLNSFYYLYN